MFNVGHDSRELDSCIRWQTATSDSVIEFGCMFGDRLDASEALTLLGVDAHLPYIEEARRRHAKRNVPIKFIHAEALGFAQFAPKKKWDTVLLVDVMEHLTARDARLLIRECKAVARKQIILFVPLGSHPQTRDVFNMGADHWQTHRSTWEPTDLTAMGFDVAVWDGYHAQPGKDSRAAFCIWEPCPTLP